MQSVLPRRVSRTQGRRAIKGRRGRRATNDLSELSGRDRRFTLIREHASGIVEQDRYGNAEVTIYKYEREAASQIHSRRVLQGRVVALDVETTGLNPYQGARIFCWAYYTEKGEYGFMLKTDANLAWVQRLLNDKTKHVVFHNAKFDLKMFSFEGIDIFAIRAHVHCTLILSKLYNMNGYRFSHELEDLGHGYCRRPTEDKTAIKDWLKSKAKLYVREHGRKPNFSDAPITLVRRRCIWDVGTTIELFEFLYKHVKQTCPALYATEIDLMFVVVDMENTGIQVDITKAKELRRKSILASKVVLNKLNNIVGKFTTTKKKTRKRKGEKYVELVPVEHDELNPNSNKQLEVVFAKMGIELKYKTKPKKGKKGRKSTGGGNWAFDEYSMIRYSAHEVASIIKDSSEESWSFEKFWEKLKEAIEENELPDSAYLPPLILKYRETTKMVSTYYDHIINEACDVKVENGREVGVLHCRFNPTEAMTGRFSCSEPNLQNIPRILGPRECFGPRKGRRIWYIDYSQVEMCLFAHFARDKEMADAIKNDIHKFVASQIYEVEFDKVTSEQRKRAKAINFGILYGSGAKKLAETLTQRGIPTTLSEAKILLRKYHKRFPSIRRLTRKLKHELIRQGYVTNPFGRRYHINKDKAYTCLNYLCQGTSADIMKAAMVKVWKYLGYNGFRSKILITVHDELGIEVVPAEESIVIPKIRELMIDRTSYYIPITVDAKVSKFKWSKKDKAETVGLHFDD